MLPFWAILIFASVPYAHGVSFSDVVLSQTSAVNGVCQCDSPRETLLFSDRPPHCLNGHVPLSLLHSKYFSNLSPCGTDLTSQTSGGISTTSTPLGRVMITIDPVRDTCGGVWEAGGSYVCNDCAKRFTPPATCTFLLNSYTAGAPTLHLNITKMGKGDGTDVVLHVYDGARGRNTLVESHKKNHTKTYTPVGSLVVLELQLLTLPVPDVSFSFLFETNGHVSSPTGGCGGTIFDSGFIFNPGYPDGINDQDSCTWIFYASSGLSPSLEILRSELSDSSGICAHVIIRDGETGAHPVIALLNGTDIRKYKGSSRYFNIQYKSHKQSTSYGFVARLTSIA